MFSDDQKASLAAPLLRSNVKERKLAGRNLSYLESWKCIEEANRIFGFDGWTSEVVEIKCVSERERLVGGKDKGWGISYLARVRVVVFAGDALITREGVGAGHGVDRDLGLAHESAAKEAESDARKRALMTFGYPLGLALYDREQANVTDGTREENERKIDQWGERRGAELARAAAPANGHRTNDVIWDESEERPATPDDDPLAETLKLAYLHSARDYVRKATDGDSLRRWYHSEESKKARDDFELTEMERADLARFCKAKLTELTK